MNDWELLQSYCRDGSERAFETLVKRHVDFVYCAALRQVRNPPLAEDVSQAVFQLLARKAGSFRCGTVLVSWLYRTTQYIASHALRSECRRRRREVEAATMNPPITISEADTNWWRVEPLLDEALAGLPGKDRDAVLLRFISRKPFREVGEEIGLSEDAAKKRVNRALARLREFFMRRGTTTLSVAVIGVILGERLVQAAPAALEKKIAASLGAAASVAASSSAGALVQAALRGLFWSRIKWGAALTAGVVAVTLLLSKAVLPAGSRAASSGPDTTVAQSQTFVNSRRAATGASGANEKVANRKLSLLVARTEDRQAIPGARVLVEFTEGLERRRLMDSATGPEGWLDIPVPTRAFGELLVWVSAEGGVPVVLRWQNYEFTGSAMSYTLLLEPGQPAAGSVVDESGNPVAGAKVYFEGPGGDLSKRENRAFHPELSRSFTDANGRWATTQLPTLPPLGQVSIRVTHPDFTPTAPSVSALPGFPTNALIVLSNGVALGGRVTAADGTPVPKARVAKQSGTYLSIRTDADGRFFWPHVEPGQVFLDVEADGFETIHEFVRATNAVNDCALTLKESFNRVQSTATSGGPRVRLHGTVVDAETGDPIPRFRVLSGEAMPLGASSTNESALNNPRLVGEGRDGQFDWQVAQVGGSRLQVEAEGYLESVAEAPGYVVAEREFNFKLRPAVTLAGRVTSPDGSPAENASVTLTGPNMGPVMESPGELFQPNPGFESTRTRTDREGRFRLKLKTGARGVAVVHESGSALLTFAEATNYAIALQPWGAIDGTLYLNGQPAPNQSVRVTGTQKLEADPQVRFFFTYSTSTDNRGHFRFDRVLPGEHSVTREVGFFGNGPSLVNSDHAAQVKVESGAVTSVELRREGRPVRGRVVFQGSPDEVQWGMSTATLRGEKTFPFALSRDGAIRAEDVPPGTYMLSVQLASATIDPLNFRKPPFGSLQKEVIVPAAEDESVPVELGELTVERGSNP